MILWYNLIVNQVRNMESGIVAQEVKTTPFIVANTKEGSLTHLKRENVIPVFM